MNENSTREQESNSEPRRLRVPLPAGYRPAIVTAITVLLGFSLLFLRFWNFELPGHWSASSIVAAAFLATAIVLEIIALWRSLQVRDDDESEYAITLRWFFAAAIILLLSLLTAGISYYHIFGL